MARKIKIDNALYDRLRELSERAGYASVWPWFAAF